MGEEHGVPVQSVNIPGVLAARGTSSATVGLERASSAGSSRVTCAATCSPCSLRGPSRGYAGRGPLGAAGVARRPDRRAHLALWIPVIVITAFHRSRSPLPIPHAAHADPCDVCVPSARRPSWPGAAAVRGGPCHGDGRRSAVGTESPGPRTASARCAPFRLAAFPVHSTAASDSRGAFDWTARSTRKRPSDF